jgi:FlaA1/EpsC-like NDP-sugar epimerase
MSSLNNFYSLTFPMASQFASELIKFHIQENKNLTPDEFVSVIKDKISRYGLKGENKFDNKNVKNMIIDAFENNLPGAIDFLAKTVSKHTVKLQKKDKTKKKKIRGRKPIPIDVRAQIKKNISKGDDEKAIAKKFRISVASVRRISKEKDECDQSKDVQPKTTDLSQQELKENSFQEELEEDILERQSQEKTLQEQIDEDTEEEFSLCY